MLPKLTLWVFSKLIKISTLMLNSNILQWCYYTFNSQIENIVVDHVLQVINFLNIIFTNITLLYSLQNVTLFSFSYANGFVVIVVIWRVVIITINGHWMLPTYYIWTIKFYANCSLIMFSFWFIQVVKIINWTQMLFINGK